MKDLEWAMKFLLSVESMAQALCVFFCHPSKISQWHFPYSGAIKPFCTWLSWLPLALELSLEMGTCVQEKEKKLSMFKMGSQRFNYPPASLMSLHGRWGILPALGRGLGKEIPLLATIFRWPKIILSSLWFPVGWSHNRDHKEKVNKNKYCVIVCYVL